VFEPGNVKNKCKDHFSTDVFLKGKKVACIEGSYMGFIKINGEKYYDLQKIRPYKLCIAKTNLPSDFSFRPDLNLLDQGKTEPA
jgi:hypothetical protein